MNFSLQTTADKGQGQGHSPGSAPAQPPTSSQDLPELHRPGSRRPLGGKAVLLAAMLLVGIAVAVAVGVPGVSRSLKGLFASATSDVIVYEVRPASLPVTVTEKGALESSNNQDVFCLVEGGTSIIMIVPEGRKVTKGELVCELDSAALKDQFTNQIIATEGAKAAYQNAKLTREVAEIAVVEYESGVYKQELQTVLGEISLAEAEVRRAEDRLEWSNRMVKKGYVSIAQNIADKVSLQQKNFAFEQAQTKKDVLIKFTKSKTVKELSSDVEKARSDELAKQQTWDLEQKKQTKLEQQIKNCKLFAPSDGLVVYANDPNRFGGSSQPQIEEGAAVRERQKIFSLPDINQMRVNTKVHESMVDRLRPGLQARIRVDAFADQQLTGKVADVAPLPDPTSFFSSDVKVYTTHVTIEKGLGGLRPGMTAQVEILVERLDNVLSVPVQAILEFKGKAHVAVKQPEGGYEWRVVVTGISNDKLVEIKDGLKTGERVALSPALLMSEEEKREAFGDMGEKDGAAKKDWGGATPGGPAGAGGPDSKGADGKAKAKGKGTGKRKGGGGGFNPAFAQKFQNIPEEDRAKLRSASPEERAEIMRKAGFTDAEIQQMQQMRGEGGGGPGGFGGPGGGGGQGGGFGGDRGGQNP